MIAVRAVVVFILLMGVVYPCVITVTAQSIFPFQSNGSLIVRNEKVTGSHLIGQPFTNPKYFWSRLSATSPVYNGASSSGSNYGPLNPDLQKAIQARIDTLRMVDPGNTQPIPVDLVTASASGLDPHISVAAADYQIKRVAHARGFSEETVRKLVVQHAQPRRLFGLLGEPVVNVLELNLALDDLSR